jgi:hypothetical protein
VSWVPHYLLPGWEKLWRAHGTCSTDRPVLTQTLKPSSEHRCTARLKRLRKKSLNLEEIIPQRLKPDLFLITYVRAEARTLQRPEFFRKL